MSSESRSRLGVGAALAALLSSAILGAHGCVQVDVYPGPRDRGSDAGSGARDAGSRASDAASVEACRECVTAQCEPTWRDCEADPDCQACLVNPNGPTCQRSTKRHDFRNCACASSTCLDACPALCPTPASTGTVRSAAVSPECIGCTSAKCAAEVTSCVVDSVCLACVSDALNPKCTASSAWNATTDCLCGKAGTCFEECCGLPP